MIPLFAQLESVPAASVKDYALITLSVLGAIYFIKGIWFDKPAKTPQPFKISQADEYAQKQAVESIKAETAAKFIELRTERATDIQNSNEGRRLIYDKIDDVRLELSDKIEDMPSKIITILKQTGAIK